MLDANEDFTLIDVREADEHAKGTIPAAVKLPRGILERDIDQVTTDKDRKIVLYCGGGFRSALAAVNLKKMGYKNVISMDGGWRGLATAEAVSNEAIMNLKGNKITWLGHATFRIETAEGKTIYVDPG